MDIDREGKQAGLHRLQHLAAPYVAHGKLVVGGIAELGEVARYEFTFRRDVARHARVEVEDVELDARRGVRLADAAVVEGSSEVQTMRPAS